MSTLSSSLFTVRSSTSVWSNAEMGARNIIASMFSKKGTQAATHYRQYHIQLRVGRWKGGREERARTSLQRSTQPIRTRFKGAKIIKSDSARRQVESSRLRSADSKTKTYLRSRPPNIIYPPLRPTLFPRRELHLESIFGDADCF